MKELLGKGAIAATCAAAAAYFHEIFVPMILLVLLMFADYISGLAGAYLNGQLSSRIGIAGIFKKVSYLFVIAVAIIVDWTLQSAAAKINLPVHETYFLGLLVIVWLIINECISVLENVTKMGAPVPPFIIKIMQHLKAKTEGSSDTFCAD